MKGLRLLLLPVKLLADGDIVEAEGGMGSLLLTPPKEGGFNLDSIFSNIFAVLSLYYNIGVIVWLFFKVGGVCCLRC